MCVYLEYFFENSNNYISAQGELDCCYFHVCVKCLYQCMLTLVKRPMVSFVFVLIFYLVDIGIVNYRMCSCHMVTPLSQVRGEFIANQHLYPCHIPYVPVLSQGLVIKWLSFFAVSYIFVFRLLFYIVCSYVMLLHHYPS